jgi:hypothetical protein
MVPVKVMQTFKRAIGCYRKQRTEASPVGCHAIHHRLCLRDYHKGNHAKKAGKNPFDG